MLALPTNRFCLTVAPSRPFSSSSTLPLLQSGSCLTRTTMEQSFRKAEMRGPGSDHLAAPGEGPAGPSYHYSTLEVALAPDYDKEAVQQPSAGCDKEVVQQPDIPVPIDQKHHVLQTPILPGGPVWAGDIGAVNEGRILGLKRRTFFIVAWIASIVLAIAVGLGAGLGATMGSRSTSTGAATAGAVTGSLPATAAVPTRLSTSAHDTSPTSTQTPLGESTGESPTTASLIQDTPSTSPPPQSTTSIKIGGVGGRCSNEWGADCICLDEGICRNKWKGTPYTGFPGN